METSSIPWIEKYRPNTFNELAHHTQIKKTLENMITNNNMMNVIFVGNMGSGKSSTARVISKKLFGTKENMMCMKLNASDQRGVNEIRDTIEKFASSSFDNTKTRMIILDEADAMTLDAQIVLSQLMDKYSKKLFFCVICNYIRKIHYTIKSRCITFRFNSLTPDSVFNRLLTITKTENITISEPVLKEIAILANGDLRRAINILYTVTFDPNINIESLYNYVKIPSKNQSKNIIDILTRGDPINKTFKTIDELITLNGFNIFQLLQIIIDYLIANKIYDPLPELAKIEMNLSGDFSKNIQLAYLISLLHN